MSVVKKTIFLLVSSLWLVACSSHFSASAERGYLKSRNGPALVVPPPLTSANMGYFYNLPPQTQKAQVSIVPATV